MKTTSLIAFLSLALSCASTARAVTITTVPVGNAGNAADSTGFGAVPYDYRIGKTEVTNAQYAEFLNAVAASDPFELYSASMGAETWGGITRSGSSGSYAYAVKADAVGQGPGGSDYTYGEKPVVYVGWYDAIRFSNWLHNGQGSGDTETGAYTLGALGSIGIPVNGSSITRNFGAKWVVPSEDEWYKAAYHKNDGATGNYWDFPTSTDTTPDNNLPSADTGNSANFNFNFSGFTTGNSSYPLTDAGAYMLSESPYGTFDQGGNVTEFNEALISPLPNPFFRGVRAGSWATSESRLRSVSRKDGDPISGGDFIGFRVARVPEPSSLLLGALAAVGILIGRRR